MKVEEILDKDEIRIYRIRSDKVDDFGLILVEDGEVTFYTEVVPG